MSGAAGAGGEGEPRVGDIWVRSGRNQHAGLRVEIAELDRSRCFVTNVASGVGWSISMAFLRSHYRREATPDAGGATAPAVDGSDSEAGRQAQYDASRISSTAGDASDGLTSAEWDANEVERHPEEYCHRCGGPNISWFTPGAAWDPVMRADGPPKWNEIICPLCFVTLAGGGTWHLIPAKDDGERWTGADERAQIIAAAETRGRAEGLREFADWWDDPANVETLRQMANLHYRAGGPSMPAILARLHADRADSLAPTTGEQP